MTKNHRIRLTLPLFGLFAVVGIVFAGGWATITLNEFPDYAVAGKPLSLNFSVRQHGQTLLTGLRPGVQATSGNGRVVKADAKAGAGKGEYTAVLIFPEPGEWTMTIASGFNTSATTLAPLKVIAPDNPAPMPFSAATRGVRLFAAKGCVACHRHLEVNPQQAVDARLDLTGKRFPPEYLRKFLADPSIKPAEMPNLKLKNDEIEALAAFINKGAMKQAPEK